MCKYARLMKQVQKCVYYYGDDDAEVEYEEYETECCSLAGDMECYGRCDSYEEG